MRRALGDAAGAVSGAQAFDVVIAGVSARALAESAAMAGLRVAAVDAYGDVDLATCAHAVALRRDLGLRYSADAAAEAAERLDAAAAAYVSNIENHPAALERLAAGRTLLGNGPAVLARVRDPLLVARALRARGFEVPAVRASAVRAGAVRTTTGSLMWLRKPRRSGGGHGITTWAPGMPLTRAAYLQAWIDGQPGSISFVADGRRAVPLGLSIQLIGDRAFGVAGFRYCGSLLAGGPVPLFDEQDRLARAALALAQAVAEEFGVVGLNGIDFVARGGIPWPVEVNPRYAASMELVERAHGVSLFALHAAACAGTLPATNPYLRPLAHTFGKAVVFAEEGMVARPMRRWLRDGSVRDVPHPGERIGAGEPICTVFAQGADAESCRGRLVRRAAAVRAAQMRAGGDTRRGGRMRRSVA
ncbi:MAG TPA: ATP-grasp domain-containing protein [Gemmatimonadales bacterium]|nr:ATP-grasp domain-containing protein [Gemmatimonadales bacterium]